MKLLKYCLFAFLSIGLLVEGKLLYAQATSADPVIPAERRIDWVPGIPAGIPNYPICANVKNAPYNAKGDGATDDSTAIQSAVDSSACASGGTIFLPAGQYRLNQILNITKKVVLRGAGPNLTTILGYAPNSVLGQITFRGGGASDASAISGYTKDSRTVTLSNASGYAQTGGDYLQIQQDNDPAVIEGTLPSMTVPYQLQILPVLSRSGNVLSLARPFYYTYSSARNVKARQLTMLKGCGLEDLKIDMRGAIDTNIYFLRTANCWVKNVESYNSNWHHVHLDSSYGNEVRHCYFHHAHTYGQGGYGVSVSGSSSDNLIEDNVFYYLRHAMIIQNGATGNVFGYNYSSRGFDVQYPNTDYLIADLEFHGGNPNMNLFEGNIGMQMMADNYWGSSRNNTYFRNYANRYSQGENKTVKYGLWAVRIDAMNLYYNLVGNVLGRPGDTGLTWLLGRDSSNNTNGVNIDPAHPPDDLRTESTMITHGNFSYIDGTTQWAPGIATHSLRDSYYLKAKPGFFGNLSWPAIGPDITDYVKTIPAKKCFEDYWQQNKGPCPMLSAGGSPGAPSNLRSLQ